MRLFKLMKRDLTIKRKIILLTIISTLIPLIIVGTFSFIYINGIIEDKISDTTSNFLSVIDWNIDTFVTDIESSSNILYASNDIQGFLKQTEFTQESYQMQQSTRELLINISNNKDYINAVYVGNEHNEYLQLNQGQRNFFGNIYDQVKHTDWYIELEQQRGSGVWFKNEEVEFLESSNLLMYGKIIRDLETLDEIGVLMISVNKTVFDQMFKNIKDEEILILDQDVIIYSNQLIDGDRNENMAYLLENAENKADQIKEFGSGKYILNFNSNDKTNWKIVSIIPYENIIKEFNIVRMITVMVLAVLFLLSTTFAFLIAKKITKQLSKLRNVAEEMEKGNSLSNVKFDSSDEIGKIGDRFVILYNRNSELTVQLYESKLKEKEAELIALQNHINPHFLYNTLNSIFWMAQKAKAKTIAKMAVSLSNIFKLTLNDGNYITLVKNEFEQVKNYIDIQNIRFDNKIDYKMNVDPSLLNQPIIKLLLQPLVENAVYHGLELQKENGIIIINGRQERDSMIFEVIDNGAGFDSKEFQETNKGYALKNIKERIKLQYGQDHGMEIESEINVGTKITLTIGLDISEENRKGESKVV